MYTSSKWDIRMPCYEVHHPILSMSMVSKRYTLSNFFVECTNKNLCKIWKTFAIQRGSFVLKVKRTIDILFLALIPLDVDGFLSFLFRQAFLRRYFPFSRSFWHLKLRNCCSIRLRLIFPFICSCKNALLPVKVTTMVSLSLIFDDGDAWDSYICLFVVILTFTGKPMLFKRHLISVLYNLKATKTMACLVFV